MLPPIADVAAAIKAGQPAHSGRGGVESAQAKIEDASLIQGLFAVALFLGLPSAGLGYWLFTGLRIGVMRVRVGNVSRSDQPIQFWVSVAVYGFFFVIFASLLLYVVWGLVTGQA